MALFGYVRQQSQANLEGFNSLIQVRKTLKNIPKPIKCTESGKNLRGKVRDEWLGFNSRIGHRVENREGNLYIFSSFTPNLFGCPVL